MTEQHENQTLRGTVMHGAIEKHGINPMHIYCLKTGRPIGESYEFGELVDSLTGEVESLIDEVVMRCLASMRPSMRWNRLRVESLDHMRVTAPAETMCYLLNRLMTPLPEDKYVGFQELHRNRVKLYAHIAAAYETTHHDSWNKVMLALLMVEARFSLERQEAPIHYANILSEASPIEALVEPIQAWALKRNDYYAQQEADAKFFAANPGARRAALSLFWEEPHLKPPSEASAKRAAKQQESNLLGAMLDELLTPGVSATKPESRRPEMPTNIRTVARPSTKMPIRFGVAKKEG